MDFHRIAVRCVQICKLVWGDTKVFSGEETPVSKRLPDRSVFLPAASADVQWPWQQCQPPDIAQRLHELHIFHESHRGKVSKSLKDVSPEKDTLISIRDASAADT